MSSQETELSEPQKAQIEEHFKKLYPESWATRLSEILAILKNKTWFGFDLDDTLHELRRASSTSTDAILHLISQESGTDLNSLKIAYRDVLAEATSNAFVEEKTSHEYRRERFSSLLEIFEISSSNEFLYKVVSEYEVKLIASLTLKRGAFELITTLKLMNKKIVVIAEGPQDAQERTLEALGLTGKIAYLATTNSFGVSKTHGLLRKVLDKIGDNELLDILPAPELGIFAVHLAECEEFRLEKDWMRISSLDELRYMIEARDSDSSILY